MASKGKYLDVRVKCPYYRKDNNSIDLNCECVYNEVSNIMRFTSPQAKNIHKENIVLIGGITAPTHNILTTTMKIFKEK